MTDELAVTGQFDVKMVESGGNAAEPGTPEDKTADTAATALAAGLTLLTAGLGVFGGLTGSVARMARNHQLSTGIAVALVLLSVVLALMSRLLRSTTMVGPARAYRLALWLALGCFVIGVGLAMLTLNDSLGEDDRPSVTAMATRDEGGNVTIAGTAQAGGLAATDQIFVRVQAQVDGAPLEEVYSSFVGPDQDGIVDHAFSVILDPGVESVAITVGNEAISASLQRLDSCAVNAATPAPSATAPPVPVEPPNEHTACAYQVIGAAPTSAPSAAPG